MTIVEMDAMLKQALKPNRYLHSVNTMKVAVRLAEQYGEDVNKAAVAGLLHDCAKDLNDAETIRYCGKHGLKLNPIEQKQIFLMHGAVGAIIAKEKYGVDDPVILNSIKNHTTGCMRMCMMDKIIFLADYIEPGRSHSEVYDAREWAFKDIDRALISAFDNIIKYVINQKGLIHTNTIEARNNIIIAHQ